MYKMIEQQKKCLEPPAEVRWPSTKSKKLDDRIHRAVLNGKNYKIRYLVTSAPNTATDVVDIMNKQGQTPLFCAAFLGKVDVVDVLLNLGANPNARCKVNGSTSVHAACYSGCVHTLKLIIQSGGDLRLTDENGDRPIDWASRQSDGDKVRAIRELIEGSRLWMMQTNGVEIINTLNSSLAIRQESSLKGNIKDIFRKFGMQIGRGSESNSNNNRENLLSNIHSTGFGKVYFGNGMRCAMCKGIPYIIENKDLQLEKEKEGQIMKKDEPSWICGKFTEFTPYNWITRKALVSTRKLRKQAGVGAVPDILIAELEIHAKLHHPNILMLMGVCQTDNLESLFLMYERVHFGSLYYFLHIKRRRLSPRFSMDIIIQIAEALEYLHSFGIIHCALTSHSIMLTKDGQAKLACFEYARQLKRNNLQTSILDPHPHFSSDVHMKELFNWTAPEVLLYERYSESSDIYSLCSIMWEICYSDVPWKGQTLEGIRNYYRMSKKGLEFKKDYVPTNWGHLMSLGLIIDYEKRDLEIAEIRDMMKIQRDRESSYFNRSNSYNSKRNSMVSFGSSVNNVEKDYNYYERERDENYYDDRDEVDDAPQVPVIDLSNELSKYKIRKFLARREWESASTFPMTKKTEGKITLTEAASDEPPFKSLKKEFRSFREIPTNGVQIFPHDLHMEVQQTFGRSGSILKKTKEMDFKTEDIVKNLPSCSMEEMDHSGQPPPPKEADPPPQYRKKPEKLAVRMRNVSTWMSDRDSDDDNDDEGSQSSDNGNGERDDGDDESSDIEIDEIYEKGKNGHGDDSGFLNLSMRVQHNNSSPGEIISPNTSALSMNLNAFPPLPRTTSSGPFKPASHCIDKTLSPSLPADINWNYDAIGNFQYMSLPLEIKGIKPAGHALSIQPNESLCSSSRGSRADLNKSLTIVNSSPKFAQENASTPTDEPIVPQKGLVFATAEKYNSFSRLPRDFLPRPTWQPKILKSGTEIKIMSSTGTQFSPRLDENESASLEINFKENGAVENENENGNMDFNEIEIIEKEGSGDGDMDQSKTFLDILEETDALVRTLERKVLVDTENKIESKEALGNESVASIKENNGSGDVESTATAVIVENEKEKESIEVEIINKPIETEIIKKPSEAEIIKKPIEAEIIDKMLDTIVENEENTNIDESEDTNVEMESDDKNSNSKISTLKVQKRMSPFGHVFVGASPPSPLRETNKDKDPSDPPQMVFRYPLWSLACRPEESAMNKTFLIEEESTPDTEEGFASDVNQTVVHKGNGNGAGNGNGNGGGSKKRSTSKSGRGRAK